MYDLDNITDQEIDNLPDEELEKLIVQFQEELPRTKERIGEITHKFLLISVNEVKKMVHEAIQRKCVQENAIVRIIDGLNSQGYRIDNDTLRETIQNPKFQSFVCASTDKQIDSAFNSTYKQIADKLDKLRKIELAIPPSPMKDKQFPKERTYEVTDLLQPYWAKNLPEDHNRKSWFHHIADELGLSFSGVAKIEREYRPAKFTPDREPNN
jgi:hypothetical protein